MRILTINPSARAFVAGLLLILASGAQAVPLTLYYQGHMMVGGGSFEGPGQLKFVLLDGQGRTLWSNDGTSINGREPAGAIPLVLRRGVYAVQLGDTNIAGMAPMAPAIFSGDILLLRIWFGDGINGFEKLSPDRAIGSVAFAVRAGVADSARVAESIPEGILEEKHLPSSLLTRVTNVFDQLNTASNSLSARLIGTNSTLSASIDAERAGRIEAVLRTVAELLAGTNQWSGPNNYSGRLTAANPGNVVNGQFSGSFAGNGAGLAGLSASSVTGTLAPGNIPGMDASKITSGVFADARINSSLARSTELFSSSNGLSDRLLATNVLLVSSVDTERADRIAALQLALANLLAGTNRWTGSNTYVGKIAATNLENAFNGSFTGSFSGNGAAVTSLTAENVAGTLAPPNIPSLDSSKITTGVLGVGRIPDLDAAKIVSGTIVDARISGNIARLTDLTTASNGLSDRLLATNTLLVGSLDTERADRIAALQQALANLLDGTNRWTGSNSYAGKIAATNLDNVFNGAFTGSFSGNGAAVASLTAENVVGTLAPINIPSLDSSKIASGVLGVPRIPDLDAAKIFSGTLGDARLSANIARLGDVNASSNGLSDRLIATNAALTAQVAALSAQLTLVSNNFASQPFPIVSTDPADTALLSLGYQNFMTVTGSAWSNGSAVNALSARYKHAGVWTGQEMLVWGGNGSSTTYSASGSRYQPDLDQWQTLSPVDAPLARSGHTAVWSGSEMLIWGGFATTAYVNSGARYQLASQVWIPMSMVAAPSAREGHTAVWTGTRMFVWGGKVASGPLGDGDFYDPATGLWSPLTVPNPPAARSGAVAVWADNRVIIWGGDGDAGPVSTGAQLLFDANGNPTQWVSTSFLNAPSPRIGHTAVWTGTRMIVWGGQESGTYLNTGALYDPVNNTWSAVNSTGAPSPRAFHTAVWTAKEMVISGGENNSGSLGTSAAFDPALGKWRSLGLAGAPEPRSRGTAFWSGTQVLVFGGQSNGQAVGALQRLNVQPDLYFYRKP